MLTSLKQKKESGKKVQKKVLLEFSSKGAGCRPWITEGFHSLDICRGCWKGHICSHYLGLYRQGDKRFWKHYKKCLKKTIFFGSVLGLSQEATSKTIIYLKSILNHAWIKKGNILLWQHFQEVNLGWKISNILLKVAL